jgi:4-hydroxy-2-oxoheptanedioate aldolase
MRSNPVKAALKAGKPQIGTWLSLASPMAARFMARCGFHWITLDIEHSPADWETAATIFGAIADAGGVPLVRIPCGSHENVKRALDLGAYGVIFPMCNSVEEAREAVAACKYAPAGRRSVGGGLHALNFQANAAEYYRRANDEILVIVQTEHIRAVENCEAIYSVPGIDGTFVGPNDLLSSMGKAPAMDSDDPEFVAALRRVQETASKCGIACGIHAADAEAANRRIAAGWQFIAISSELGFMQSGAQEAVRKTIGAAAAGGQAARY